MIVDVEGNNKGKCGMGETVCELEIGEGVRIVGVILL